MKICNDPVVRHKLVPGELWKCKGLPYIYIVTDNATLINLATGDTYAGYTLGMKRDDAFFVNVTKDYCLQRISKCNQS